GVGGGARQGRLGRGRDAGGGRALEGARDDQRRLGGRERDQHARDDHQRERQHDDALGRNAIGDAAPEREAGGEREAERHDEDRWIQRAPERGRPLGEDRQRRGRPVGGAQ